MEGLVLSRKVGEAIELNGPGVVRLVGIRGNRAVWQIVAPRSTTILRDELIEDEQTEGGDYAAPERA